MKRIFTIGCGLFFLSNLLLGQSRPYISGLDKTSAPAGEKVAISGINLPSTTADAKVKFGGGEATVVYASTNLLEVTVPASATFGPVSVTNTSTGLTAYSSESFLLSYGGTVFDDDALDAPVKISPSQDGMYDLCTCDFDANGTLDIATSHWQDGSIINKVPVFSNSSTPTSIAFTATNQSTLTINEQSFSVNCGDLDGDGKPELLATRALAGVTPGDVIFVFKNNSTPGDIKFNTSTSLILPTDASGNRKNVSRVMVIDLDRDGKPEVIATNEVDGNIDIFRNTSEGGTISFDAEVAQFPMGGTKSAGLAVKDLNNDGFPEIIVNALQQADIYVLSNVSSPGTISFGSPITIPVSGQLVNLVAGDFNGDGFNDLAATQAFASVVSIVLNQTTEIGGQLSFATPTSISVSSGPWGIDAGDVNGDGKLDILVASTQSNNITLLSNTTDAALSFSRFNLNAGEITRNVKIGDINSDGKPDLLATGIANSNLIVFANRNCLNPVINPATARICKGSDFILEATTSVGHSYTWETATSSSGPFTNAGSSGPSLNLTGLAPGSIFARVTVASDDGICQTTSSLATIEVLDSPAPTHTVGIPLPICEGETLTVDGSTSEAKSYEWTGPNGFTSSDAVLSIPDFDASKAGIYTYRYISQADCSSPIQEVRAEVKSLPTMAVRYNGNGLFCEDATVSLSAPLYPGYDYQWFADGNGITGETSASYTARASGQFTIRILDPVTNCSATSEAQTLTRTGKPVSQFNTLDLICEDVPLDFTATSTGAAGLSLNYSWDFENDASPDNTAETTTHTYTNSGTVTAVLTTGYDEIANCASSVSKSITVRAVPTIDISAPDGTEKCPESSVTLEVPDTYVSYEWSTSETTNIIVVPEPGTYTVTIIDDAQCTIDSSIEVINFDTSNSITLTTNRAVIDEMDTTQFVVTGASVIQGWDPTTGMDDPSSATPIVTGIYVEEDFDFLVNGQREYTYVVSALDMNGCEVSASVNLSVIPEENPQPMKSFSPNGDGIDDEWKVENVEFNEGCKLVIYDRRGRMILEKTPYNNDWDGTINGNPMEQGVYYYVFICEDPARNRNGSILLFR